MLSNDPGYWRRRAEEARDLAKQMHDEQNKRMMRKIATAYDGLAIKASTPSDESRRAHQRGKLSRKAGAIHGQQQRSEPETTR
jgi:hypothetical protein